MIASIKDIAKQLGIAASTVSRAMNNHPDVSAATKKLVMETARELNYRPNAIAKGLISKKTYTIGLMIPEIADPFFSSLANAIEDMLSEYGYQVVYGNTNRKPSKEKLFITNAISRQFDGLILTPDHLDEELIDILNSVEMPVVFLRRRTPAQLNIPFVDVDHYEAACNAINYLLELGHSKIGMITMPKSSFSGSERLRGYEDTMKQHGLSFERYIVQGGRSIEHGRKAMEGLYANNPELTAIFAANDLLGIGALEWIARREEGLLSHLSVIGFDNLEYTDLHWIQLTTMEQPREEMGRKAASLLLEMINNKQNDHAVNPSSLLIEARLIVRKSCKRWHEPKLT